MNSKIRNYETSWTWKKGVSMERTLRENIKNENNEKINNNIINDSLNDSLNDNPPCIPVFSQQNTSQTEKIYEHPTSVSSFMDSMPLIKQQYESENIKTGKMTFKRDNIRCENNEKLSSREHMIQRNVNPFLVDNDFKKDLEIQNEFLIPKNSNYEKEQTISL